MKKKEVIEQLISHIKDLIDPQKVILFGSYAYGNPDKDSDIDLLIVADIEDDQKRKYIRSVLRKKIPSVGIGKDFIVVSPQELETYKNIVGTVIYPALRGGKVIYERRD